jgi:hypothetical protein
MEFEKFKAALVEREIESDVFEQLRREYLPISKKARLMEFKIVMRDSSRRSPQSSASPSLQACSNLVSPAWPGRGVVLMIADAVFIAAAFHTVRIRYR